jgi:hypothetical protein
MSLQWNAVLFQSHIYPEQHKLQNTDVLVCNSPIKDKYHRRVNIIRTRRDGSRSSQDHACDLGLHTDVCITGTEWNRSAHRIDVRYDRRHFKQA